MLQDEYCYAAQGGQVRGDSGELNTPLDSGVDILAQVREESIGRNQAVTVVDLFDTVLEKNGVLVQDVPG